MNTNYDSDGVPQITPELVRESEALGMHIVHIICAEKGSEPDDPSGVTFLALVPFMPNRGDRITLEDGTVVEVHKALFALSRTMNNHLLMTPNIMAYKVMLSSQEPPPNQPPS